MSCRSLMPDHDGPWQISQSTKVQGAMTKRLEHPRQPDRFALALIVFSVLFVALTLSAGILCVNWRSAVGVLYFIGFALLFVGIAFDLTEILLAFSLSPQYPPHQSPIHEFPPVALLMALCDDAVPEVLEQIGSQNYANCDVFVLDDSQDEVQQALVDQYGYAVQRRGTRKGYKAGNLNHWLDRFGSQYEYVVILDSDSKIPDDFVLRMVEYAEHPKNRNVAVFQSKILNWNTARPLSRLVGALAPLRMHILERLANSTGTMLSWGHNNMIRCDCLLRLGGFCEHLTCEDTVLSLALGAAGYTIKLVDVLSYDAEPDDAFRYTRRTVRWARQTVDLFDSSWHLSPIRLKLLLCYQLYGFLIHNVYFGLLLLTAWTSFDEDGWSLRDSITLIFNGRLYLTPWFLVLLAMTGTWVLQVVLRCILARRANVSPRDFLFSSVVSTSLMCFMHFSVSKAILQAILGDKTQFVPTNAGQATEPSLTRILKQWSPTLMFCGLVIAGIVARNRYLLLSLNSLWLVTFLLAPAVLWCLHRDRTNLEQGV